MAKHRCAKPQRCFFVYIAFQKSGLMADIHIVNGPNLNLLGRRQPEIYGKQHFEAFFEELKERFAGHRLHYFQSNSEGALIDYLHKVGFGKVGIVLNAGAYTHTSIALADAVAAIAAPVVEVHISNVYARESFRHHSYLAPVCVGSIVGLGFAGYALAVQYLLDALQHEK
jgi:3-dehydroquinate dehydratase-2